MRRRSNDSEQRYLSALVMRRAGKRIEEIAKLMGVKPERAHQMVLLGLYAEMRRPIERRSRAR